MGFVKTDKDPYSKAHLRQIKKTSLKSVTPLGHVFDHYQSEMKSANLFKGMMKDYLQSQDETMAKDIYDIIEIYKTLFRNLELVIQEELNRNTINHREALDVLCAFSISGEATNILLERIFEIIYPSLQERKYTKHDLELIINHFPQEFWQNSLEHGGKRDSFNYMISELLKGEITGADTRELLSFFQAFSRSENFPRELMNKILNEFATLLESNKLDKKQLLEFVEIYTIMIQENGSISSELDSSLLFSIISKNILNNYKSQNFEVSFQQLAMLYWGYMVWGIYPQDSSEVFALEEILNEKLALYIAKYKRFSEAERYTGSEQELEFDENDAKTIIYYYETCESNGFGKNNKQIIKTLQSIIKKYDDRPEKERKWFVW